MILRVDASWRCCSACVNASYENSALGCGENTIGAPMTLTNGSGGENLYILLKTF